MMSNLSPTPTAFTFRGGQGRHSTWRYWNADWEPTRPRGVPRLGGFITTISTPVLEAFLKRHDLATGRHCAAILGSRQYTYAEMTLVQRQLQL